eukprot:392996-Amphidinium_carterae.1
MSQGASDIVGRPRWGYFREFRCVPKRRRGRPRRAPQTGEPPLLGRAGSTQARPGRARPRAGSEGLLAPLRRRSEVEPLARPGFDNRRDLSLQRETQDSQARPGVPASQGLSLLRETQNFQARPEVSVRRGPSLQREACPTLVRPGRTAAVAVQQALPSDDGG